MTSHNSDYHCHWSSGDHDVGLGGERNPSAWASFNGPSNAGCFISYVEGTSSFHSSSTVGSLNLPDIILRYLLILNEGCMT